jgi:uncharacterized RDD family membrane protein YckC
METTWEGELTEHKREYAGFWIRFAAYLLDSIIIGIPVTILNFVVIFGFIGSTVGFEALMDPNYIETAELTDQEAISLLLGYLVSLIISLIITVLYYAGMHASKWQATIGKKLLGLVVTDLKGNRISFWRGLGRYLAMAFLSSIFMIGFIVAAFTEKKQSLHDLIAGTFVLKKS